MANIAREIVSFDWAIKNILRDKANFDVLEGFLLALLDEKIKITEIAESESNQDSREMKFNRVDVLAINSKGEHIIIEVQYSPEQSYFKRLLYGTSKDIIDNMKSGHDCSLVKKVYSVSLIYFDVEAHEDDKNHSDYVFRGRVEFKGFHSGNPVKINPTFLVGYDEARKDDINIFPEYFIIPVGIFNGEVKDNLDEWIYAFKNSEIKEEFKAPGIKEMGEKLNFISMTPEKQKAYRRYQEDLASVRGTFEFNALKAEKKKALEIASEMKHDGLSANMIMKYTGLSEKEIEKL
ncbi:MAG: Rpn family recombination-promoting nuclease/putative transposase [Proteobacteria bacterium]|nr:Rpn family recombination-promoting nuclease/putative transposase [Pseudomonadota bacterium]